MMSKSKSMDKLEKGPSGQLERAFDVINTLINSLQPLKLTALSEVTGLDASGTLRLLKTLIDLGYVTRDDSRKSYLASARAFFPLGLFHPFQELRRDAADLLFAIQRDTTATSALQVFLGGQRVVLEQRAGSNRLTPFVDPTVKSAYHSSSSGKLFLSTLSAEERITLVGRGPFEKFTQKTLATVEELNADISLSQARGFFAVCDEALVGMSSIAAPLRVPNGGIIGCMLAFGTSEQLPPETLVERGMTVKRAADMLSTMSPAVRALEQLLGHHAKTGKTNSAALLKDKNGKC